ncbi:MAG TPA: hypothetical protein VNR00_12650 [Opitutus sp.]|nr:hypothetical protein [Opitutus sp.]
MKDSKFIELLNLYVDHQISAEDAARLEAEIQRTPERRRIYRQYCQMQKACSVLAENFRTQVPPAGKVVEFPRQVRSRLRFATYGMGMLAAAACVALVLVERTRLNERVALQQVAAEPALAAIVAAPPAQPAPAPARPALQPAFAGLIGEEAKADAAFAADIKLDWMNRVNLQRLPAQEFWFDSHPTVPTDFIFRSPRPAEPQTTLAAFRFQR